MGEYIRYQCPTCQQEHQLADASLSQLTELAVWQCHCGEKLTIDSEQIADIKGRASSNELINAGVVISVVLLAVLAMMYHVMAIILPITFGMVKFVYSRASDTDVVIHGQLFKPDVCEVNSRITMQQFRQETTDRKKIFNPVAGHCCVCSQITKQVIGRYRLCCTCEESL